MPGDKPSRPDPATPLRQRLRARIAGRKRWIVAAAALGAGIGGSAGYLAVHPQYRATGWVTVKPIAFDAAPAAAINPPATAAPSSAAKPETEADAAWRLKTIEDGVRQQVTLLQSPALLREALALPADQALPLHALTVTGSEDHLGRIFVAWTDPDPQHAQAQLAHVLDAYQKSPLYRTQQEAADRALQQWAAREVALRDLSDLEKQQTQAAKQGDLPALQQAYTQAAAQQQEIDRQAQAVELALATLADDRQRGESASLDAMVQLTPEQRRELTAQRDQLDQQIQRQQTDINRITDAVALLSLTMRRASLEQRLQAAWQAEPRVTVRVTSQNIEGSVEMTRDQLLTQRQKLARLADQARAEVARLNEQIARLRELDTQATQLSRKVEHHASVLAQFRAEPVRVEARVDPQIETPELPYHDDRLMTAGMGGGIGLGLGLLLATGWVLRDDRMRHADDRLLHAAQAPMIGAMPTLPHEHATRADADLAAMSMHQVRARLESMAEAEGARAFAFASADDGAGKTSLAVGLASSLAMAGHRTLLIDCDLGKRARASAESAPEHPGLDQVLRSMGHMAEHTAELFVANDKHAGLLGVLHGRPLTHCVVETRVKNLDALPALNARPEHAGQLSGKTIRRLIAIAEEHYDYILIDSGSVPGSVEALLIAANVAGVVIVASPGQRQARFDRALSQLRLVGANVIGTVFNRATAHDVSEYLGMSLPRRHKKGTMAGEPWRPLDYGTGSGIFAAAVETQSRSLPSLPPLRPTQPDATGRLDGPRAAGGREDEANPPSPFEPRPLRAPMPEEDPFPEPDTESHKILGDAVDQMIQDTILLAMNNRRQRALPGPTPQPDNADDLEAQLFASLGAADDAHDERATAEDVDAELNETIDQMIEAARTHQD